MHNINIKSFIFFYHFIKIIYFILFMFSISHIWLPTNPLPTPTTTHNYHHQPNCYHLKPQPKINPPLTTTATKQPPNHKTHPSNNQSQNKHQNPDITKPSHQITNQKTTTITNTNLAITKFHLPPNPIHHQIVTHNPPWPGDP